MSGHSKTFVEQFKKLKSEIEPASITGGGTKIPADVLNGRTECDAMNALQNHGIISDNAVDWRDVGNTQEAIDWLRANPEEK
jgi:hypothetical protein